MVSEPIHVDDNTDIAKALDESPERPILLERNGTLYRLIPANSEERPTEYDPEAVRPATREATGALARDPDTYDPDALRSAIEKVSGMFSDEEADEIIERIYKYRRLGSRPASRP